MPLCFIVLSVGAIKRIDHVIADTNRISQRFELERLIGNAVARWLTRDRAEREDEMIVGQSFLAIRQADPAFLEIDADDLRADYGRAPETAAQRRRNVCRFQTARGHFRQHWREE